MFEREPSPSIKRACLILFGPEVQAGPEFLSYLQPEGLKAAFRSKAFSTHPDRAEAVGKNRDYLNEQFIKVVWAYEQLKTALVSPAVGTRWSKSSRASKARRAAKPSPPPPPKTKPEPPQRDLKGEPRYYNGEPPLKVLRIGEFLYYSGKVAWQDFMAALNWQKRQRASFGEIAMEWNLLSQEDVVAIMTDRNFAEPFGEAAIRKGLLSRFWVRAILHHQAKTQPRLGRYFVETGILSRVQLGGELERLKIHNRRALKRYH
jgi:hypothetical protein